ncbi:discoidin domain-containing protein [Clostridium tetani]|uniref:discoidin domain-containing protein n=1 Tax=Clostridium tetani TaxID=1513 RepID=UPI0024A9D39F|nr:discoidin domain-containing protein [Clostridium tetani]
MAGNTKPPIYNLGKEGKVVFIEYDSSSGRDHIDTLLDGRLDKHGSYGVLLSSYGARHIIFSLEQDSNLWCYGQYYRDSGGSTSQPVTIYKEVNGEWKVFKNEAKTENDKWYMLCGEMSKGKYKIETTGRYTMFTEWYTENLERYKFLVKQNNKYYSINPEYYKDEQYQSLSLKSEEYPNNNDFNKYGFNNLNELLKEYKKSNIKSSGSDLGFGKVFSFKIDDNFKCVSNLELVGETLKWSNDVTDSLKKENFTSSKYHTGRYNYIPYLAFDNHIDNNGMTGFQIKNPSDKDWLKIDFAKPVRPSKLTLQGNAGDVSVCVPKKIEISMSNDDINYTIIDTIDNIIKDDKYNEYVYKKPNKKYRYLKIRFLEFYSSVWCTINQMEFFESLYVEKYLIQDKNLNLYTYKDDTLTKLDNNSVTESNFKGNGFTEIEVITREMLLNQFGNLENIKLLLWTDNINKEECIMEYHLKKPLRPIDMLKKSNSGKFDIVMMEI